MAFWKEITLTILSLGLLSDATSVCNGGFAGAQCEVFLPVYSTAPGVAGSSETAVKLSINTSPVNPQQTPPTAFIVEYQRVGAPGNSWVTHATVENTAVVVHPYVTGLSRGESYRFRFIPLVEQSEDQVFRGKESPASGDFPLDKDCPVGDFDIECELTCHCADEARVCDPEAGVGCSTCSQGYAGQNCWLRLTTLSNGPTLTAVHAHKVSLQIMQWVPGVDAGEMPESYRVQSKEVDTPGGWTNRLNVEGFKVTAGALRSWDIIGLIPCTKYLFRIVPVAKNWEGHFPGTPGPVVSAKTRADDECFEERIDYIGGDLNTCGDTTTNVAACQNLCTTNSACYYFTWRTRERKCCLKRNTGWQRQNMDNRISGPKYCVKSSMCSTTDKDEDSGGSNTTIIIVVVILIALVAIMAIIAGVVCYKRSHRTPEMMARWQPHSTQRPLPTPPVGICGDAPPLPKEPPGYLEIGHDNPTYIDPGQYDNNSTNRIDNTYDDLDDLKISR